MAKKKIYKEGHEKITVLCPLCHTRMSGWTYTGDLKQYLINHQKPRKEQRWPHGSAL